MKKLTFRKEASSGTTYTAQHPLNFATDYTIWRMDDRHSLWSGMWTATVDRAGNASVLMDGTSSWFRTMREARAAAQAHADTVGEPTPYDALVFALEQAVHDPNEDRMREIVKMAEQIAAGMSEVDVQRAKRAAEFRAGFAVNLNH
jgi:hypothetical protein